MTISLDHVELTSFPRFLDGESTYVRYWQAQIPGTDLYAMTEEGFTTYTGFEQHLHTTRFFVCNTPATEHGPARGVLVQDDVNEYGKGRIYDACEALTEPHTWDDAPRQRMLEEAIERRAQANA
jgi:hypothetical protein